MVNVYQEFIGAGVNAYALGCTDEGLRKELAAMKESGVEIDALQSYGGGTSLKSKIFSEEVIHFLCNRNLYVFLAFVLHRCLIASYIHYKH